MLQLKNFRLLPALLLFPFIVHSQTSKLLLLNLQESSKQAFVYEDKALALDSCGAIISGTLATTQVFSPQGTDSKLFFLAGCPIDVNQSGKVIRGTLAMNYRLRLPGGKTTAFFKGGCEVVFNANGQVIKGALYFPQHFKLMRSTRRQYIEKDAVVNLNKDGEVTSFILDGGVDFGCEPKSPTEGAITAASRIQKLYEVIRGGKTDYDKTVLTAIRRNKWTNTIAVVDVTESMEPYMAQVYFWQKLNYAKNNTHYYVFFNDGDGRADSTKIIGATGGLYGTNTDNSEVLLQTMVSAMKNGTGGDQPENDIEAMIYGISKYRFCSSIIHVADNNSTPRDLSIISKVKKPVHVIACGVKGPVNPALLDIARKTNGSLSTIEEDIKNLAGVKIGSVITVGGQKYKLYSDGFKFVN